MQLTIPPPSISPTPPYPTPAQRHRLSELSEQHSDLLGLLAQQEVELGVFRAVLGSQVEYSYSVDSLIFLLSFSCFCEM